LPRNRARRRIALQPKGVAAISVAIPTPSRPTSRFFLWIAVAAAIAVSWGFAPTYYLRAFIVTRDLSPLLHLHGFVFSCWIALLVIQTTLVAKGRTDLHRKLGILGVALAAAVVGLGVAVGYLASAQLQRAFAATDGPIEAFALLAARNPGNAMIFGLLAAAGVFLFQPAFLLLYRHLSGA
jgi:hypothetical protein